MYVLLLGLFAACWSRCWCGCYVNINYLLYILELLFLVFSNSPAFALCVLVLFFFFPFSSLSICGLALYHSLSLLPPP